LTRSPTLDGLTVAASVLVEFCLLFRMQRSSASEGHAKDVVEFTLKPRSSKLRLSATHVTASMDESQHLLCKRIAEIAHLPLNRLRVSFETSNLVVDKRVHKDEPPKIRDIANAGTVLIIKDLGTPVPPVNRTQCALYSRQLAWTDLFRSSNLMENGVCG
jgi:hypothetical protein